MPEFDDIAFNAELGKVHGKLMMCSCCLLLPLGGGVSCPVIDSNALLVLLTPTLLVYLLSLPTVVVPYAHAISRWCLIMVAVIPVTVGRRSILRLENRLHNRAPPDSSDAVDPLRTVPLHKWVFDSMDVFVSDARVSGSR